MVFISHANPEENEFARWLTLQLANEGYPVWCDVTKLLGGEKFWEDIQDAIANRTAKFVFALSQSSNHKTGPLDELNCALGTEKKLKTDFIVPLKLDDLAYEDVYIGIQRRNHIDFRKSWAQGLSKLLERLKEDNLPKDPKFNPEAVCTWCRSQQEFSADQGLLHKPDEHLSNWFTVDNLPSTLYRHIVTREGIGKIDFDASKFRYPAVKDSELSFLTFAQAQDFDGQLPPKLMIEATQKPTIESVLDRKAPRGYPVHLTQLLRLAWERMMAKTGLRIHELSNRAQCFYFIRGAVENDRLFFDGVEGKRAYRDVIGYATRIDRKRYWHYGINAKPALYPTPHYVVKGHVLFSDDGLSLWKSKEKLAKARRSQCKNWWNDEWRDRLLAVMTHLANGEGKIVIPVASDYALTVSRSPETFESPVSYLDPEAIVKEEHDDYALEDEESDDGGEELVEEVV